MQQAQSYLAGMANPFENVLQSYDQGLQSRSFRDDMQAKQAEQARKLQAQQSLENVDWSNQNDIAKVVAQFPEYTKGAQDYYNNMEAKEQKAYLADSAKAISAIDSGRPDIAVQSLRDQANAYRDSGNESKAEELSEIAELIAKNPTSARKAIAMGYAVNAPKDWAANYKAGVDSDISQNESPYNIAKTQAETGKVGAETGEVQAKTDAQVAESISNSAVTQDPSYFSLRVGQLAQRGLIAPNEEKFLTELMTDDPARAAEYLRAIAKGNPDIAKAFMPEIIKTNTGGSEQLDEYDPMTGELVNKGSYDVTQTPDNFYTNQQSNTNSVRSAETSRYGYDTQANTAANAEETKRRKIAVDEYLKKQELEEQKGALTRQVMPDGRVLLFDKNGNWKPVIDSDGEPMISKKSDTDKPMTDAQGKNLAYGKRMQTANKILLDLEASTGGSWDVKGGTLMSRVFGNRANSEEGKKYEQAKRNFVNAILRNESGAAIAESEFESANKQYFPQIGDTEAVIKQKAANRKQVTESMLSNAGSKGVAQIGKSSEKVKTADLF